MLDIETASRAVTCVLLVVRFILLKTLQALLHGKERCATQLPGPLCRRSTILFLKIGLQAWLPDGSSWVRFIYSVWE